MNDYKNTKLLDVAYQRDTAGKIRIWRAEIGYNDENEAGFRVHTGIFNGKIIASTWKKAEPKNVGKSNATTAFVQAQLEAKSQWQKKIDAGYFPDMGSIDSEDIAFKPMLAQTFDPKTFDWSKNVLAQPKLDGIRCLATRKGLFTRNGKEIISCPHIWEKVRWVFDKDPNVVIDGELYNHELKDNFNEITSIVRKTKLTSDDISKSEKCIQYHVYDIYTGKKDDFLERLELLTSIVEYIRSDKVRLVETFPVSNEEDLDTLYADMIEAGYEGQMIRINDFGYENKRSKSLLKRKEFLTDEFEVVNIEEGEGNWSRHIKRFICKFSDGKEFGAGVRGNQDTLKALFESKEKPDWATVRYFTPTPDGVPRFPVVVDWGIGKRVD